MFDCPAEWWWSSSQHVIYYSFVHIVVGAIMRPSDMPRIIVWSRSEPLPISHWLWISVIRFEMGCHEKLKLEDYLPSSGDLPISFTQVSKKNLRKPWNTRKSSFSTLWTSLSSGDMLHHILMGLVTWRSEGTNMDACLTHIVAREACLPNTCHSEIWKLSPLTICHYIDTALGVMWRQTTKLVYTFLMPCPCLKKAKWQRQSEASISSTLLSRFLPMSVPE